MVYAFNPPSKLPTGKSPTNVILGVAPPLEAIFPEPVTEVTVPPPLAAVAHVPSPRQKVVDPADVPEFKCDTDKLPVTPFARLT